MSSLNRKFFGFFLLNFVACCIAFLLFFQLYFYQEYSYEKCNNLSCITDNFRHIYIYYFTVFLYLNIVYWLCFFYFKFYKDTNRFSVKRWLALKTAMFTAGFVIYAANKYYRSIWDEYSLPEWWISVFLQFLNDVIFKYGMVLVMTALITCLFTYLACKKAGSKKIVNPINYKHFE